MLNKVRLVLHILRRFKKRIELIQMRYIWKSHESKPCFSQVDPSSRPKRESSARDVLLAAVKDDGNVARLKAVRCADIFHDHTHFK